jgi:hypothetical protein
MNLSKFPVAKASERMRIGETIILENRITKISLGFNIKLCKIKVA